MSAASVLAQVAADPNVAPAFGRLFGPPHFWVDPREAAAEAHFDDLCGEHCATVRAELAEARAAAEDAE